MIKIVDQAFSEEDHLSLLGYCRTAPYHYGERDKAARPPTGLVSEIDSENRVFMMVASKILEKFPEIESASIYRMYVNCFAPGENPYFHVDGKAGYTFLYYPDESWDRDEGGETQFLIDGEIQGVLPLPNRLVMFDATLLHKATSFRSRHRFTLAVKCL